MMRSVVSIALFLLFAASFAGGCDSSSEQAAATQGPSDEEIILKCRQETVSLDQVDAELGEWEEWQHLRAQIEPGDELWTFSTPGPTWEQLLGWEGYALFRDGKLVGSVTTMEN